MPRRRWFLATSLWACLWVCVAHVACLAETPGEFVPLFNGKDFSGWRFGAESEWPKAVPGSWKVNGGIIVAEGDARAFLASQWDYEDFELQFEWRAVDPSFDADLFAHAGRTLQADPIRIAKGLEGAPQETDRGEGQYNAGPRGMIGGGGNNRKAVPELQKPVGEWNSWRLLASGGKFLLECNGKPAWECHDHVPRRGYLGFRVRRGPMEFRNIRLREIGYAGIMNPSDWEIYPGFGGRGPLEAHWKQEGRTWVFSGPGPSIVTKKKTYADYQLRLEFLFADSDPSDTNTGIYLRGVHPWQADIWEHKWGSGLWGVLHTYEPAKKNIQDLGKVIRPIVKMDNPQGQWNYLEIRVENNVVSSWLNGQATVDRYPVKKVDPKFPDRGGIGLQAHWPWKEVRFHNMRVKQPE